MVQITLGCMQIGIFDGAVLTGKFCVGVPLNIQSIYLN